MRRYKLDLFFNINMPEDLDFIRACISTTCT